MPPAKHTKSPRGTVAKPTVTTRTASARSNPKTVNQSPRNALLAEWESIVDAPGLWLDTPNALFGGRAPGELVDAPDEQLVWEWVAAVKQGMPA